MGIRRSSEKTMTVMMSIVIAERSTRLRMYFATKLTSLVGQSPSIRVRCGARMQRFRFLAECKQAAGARPRGSAACRRLSFGAPPRPRPRSNAPGVYPAGKTCPLIRQRRRPALPRARSARSGKPLRTPPCPWRSPSRAGPCSAAWRSQRRHRGLQRRSVCRRCKRGRWCGSGWRSHGPAARPRPCAKVS